MEATNNGKEGEKNFKNRFMGKLFKEKRPALVQDADQDVDSFLRGSSDRLYMMPATDNSSHIPPLSVDTTTARRWPAAADINDDRRRRSTSHRPSRKGLVVRFTEENPEVIGEGGDECSSPVAEIGARKRAHTHPKIGRDEHQGLSRKELPPGYNQNAAPIAPPPPLPLRRTQTGLPLASVGSDTTAPNQENAPPLETQSDFLGEGFLKTSDHDSSTFAADLKAEMRAAEGRALVKAAHELSPMNQHFPRPESPLPDDLETSPELNELHINTLSNATMAPPPDVPPPRPSTPPTSKQIPGPLSIPQRTAPDVSRTPPPPVQQPLPPPPPNIPQTEPPPIPPQPSPKPQGVPAQLAPGPPQPPADKTTNYRLPESMTSASRTSSTTTMQEVALAAGDDALKEFSKRSAHLYTLFRLAAESVRPFPKCSPQQLVRVALWWFLKGRASLEKSIRERPTTPESQQANALTRHQAHADLGKALWIIETVISQYPQRQTVSTEADSPMADLLSAQQNILSSLKKLSMSMKRNNLLPPDPENAPLLQGLDHTIWIADDGERSLVTSQRFSSTFSLGEAFALGDSTQYFLYGRLFAEAVLLEESESNYYRCHVLLSIIRGQQDRGLTVTIASQDGLFNIGIQNDKTRGPTWNDVNWDMNGNTLELNLPRGFTLRLHCQPADFTAMWDLFDLHQEIYAILDQRPGEELVFESTVRTFQQFEISSDADAPPPRDSLPNCHLKVFERIGIEKGANQTRRRHQGFRIGLCSNPRTKNLKGVDRTLLPTQPILFGFLRGENGLPAFLLKSSDEKSEHNIVFTFEDVNQRTRFHALLSGIALIQAEEVVAEDSLKAFTASNQRSYEAKCLNYLAWQNFQIINESHGELHETKTVLSDHLRVVLDFKAGTVTDRINVGPGELKLRLGVKTPNEITLFRPPQQDLTISVSESQVLQELPAELSTLLRIMSRYDTTRTFTFSSLSKLHKFQTALTGFRILFDGFATSFNISRRRMVVPIYKKWDASTTRLQLVERDKVIQLIAFFEDFSHGDSMAFVLKSTDIFESSGRSSKHAIRIVDAKFALPKARIDGEVGDAPFICLDMPDYPGEHDDITIVFENDDDRDKFANALPAPLKTASRMASIRR